MELLLADVTVMVHIVWTDVLITLSVLTAVLLLIGYGARPRPGLSRDGKVLTLTAEQWDRLMREAKPGSPPEGPRP